MFFAALFAMYFTHRSVNPELWAESTPMLNIPFSSANTFILVASSVTCQLGVFAAERGDAKGLRKWFIITFIMFKMLATIVHFSRFGIVFSEQTQRFTKTNSLDHFNDYIRIKITILKIDTD